MKTDQLEFFVDFGDIIANFLAPKTHQAKNNTTFSQPTPIGLAITASERDSRPWALSVEQVITASMLCASAFDAFGSKEITINSCFWFP